VIFAVLDVSLAVNLCINCSLKNIFAVLLCFCSCCPWTAFYHWTAFTYHRTAPDFIVLIGLFLVSFSFNFSVRFHVVDSVDNSSVVTAREIHSVVSHRCTITIIIIPKFWGFCLEPRQFVST